MGSARYPDLYGETGEEPDPEPPEVEEPIEEDPENRGLRAADSEEELTPMGERRSTVTEADDNAWVDPKPSVLKQSTGKQKINTREQRADRRPAR